MFEGRASLQEVQNQELQRAMQQQQEAYQTAYGTGQPVVPGHAQMLDAVGVGSQDPQAYNRMMAEYAASRNPFGIGGPGGGGGGGGGNGLPPGMDGLQTGFSSPSPLSPFGQAPMTAPTPVNIGGNNQGRKPKSFPNPF